MRLSSPFELRHSRLPNLSDYAKLAQHDDRLGDDGRRQVEHVMDASLCA